MRRTLFLLLALSCLLAVGCGEDDAPAPVPGVVTSGDFPLIDGLTYTYLTGSGDGPLVDTARVVLADYREPGPGRDSFGYGVYLKPQGSSEEPSQIRGIIWLHGPDTLTVTPMFEPNTSAKYIFPFEVGDTWGSPGTNRIVTMERLELPAGRFDNAYRICFSVWPESETGCGVTHWFVPGVGIVKIDYRSLDHVDENLRVWELLSVSPELNP